MTAVDRSKNERERAYNKAYRASHKAERAEYQRLYRARNREAIKAYVEARKRARDAACQPTQRTCIECGAEFSYEKKSGVFRQLCSDRCRAVRTAKRDKETYRSRRGIGSTRTRACEECGNEFTYTVGRGYDKRLCSDFCRGKRRHAARLTQPLCSIPGCTNPRRQVNPAICEKHYYRLKRTGDTSDPHYAYRSRCTSGYIRIFREHALSVKGFVYEHRMVLFDAIGEGPHKCHWCGVSVKWIKGRCVRGALVTDHLDGDKANNEIANLVPACNPCNANRGMFMGWVRKHQDDPVLWAMYESAQREAQRGRAR